MKRMKKMKGFTLIELLIVVAIIAILAAIAIPNFLEAQIRSKVSRCRADMRTTLTALESYGVDHTKYPPMGDNNVDPLTTGFHSRVPNHITTPIAYMTSLVYDPFVDKSSTFFNTVYPVASRVGERYVYYNVAFMYTTTWGAIWRANELESRAGAHLIYGYGPDRDWTNWGARTMTPYDPTNGTVSAGNIIRTQRHTEGIFPRSDGTW